MSHSQIWLRFALCNRSLNFDVLCNPFRGNKTTESWVVPVALYEADLLWTSTSSPFVSCFSLLHNEICPNIEFSPPQTNSSRPTWHFFNSSCKIHLVLSIKSDINPGTTGEIFIIAFNALKRSWIMSFSLFSLA